MNIALAQIASEAGDLTRNRTKHLHFCQKAATHGADFVLFPELSLSGYEPALAAQCAVTLEPTQWHDFQCLSDQSRLTIAIGVPLKQMQGIEIALLIFQPHQPLQHYSKHYLHASEEAYFVPGEVQQDIMTISEPIALAICYELSVPAHAEAAFNRGATIYLCSVMKEACDMPRTVPRLIDIATTYQRPVAMVNSVGTAHGATCCGQTSVWDNQGRCLTKLDDQQEGLLLFNTQTHHVNTYPM